MEAASARRDGQLGAIPAAPAAGSVKRSTEKISAMFLARWSWQGWRGSGGRRASRALVHGVGFNRFFRGGETETVAAAERGKEGARVSWSGLRWGLKGESN
jgi:hypothetical protein